MDLLSRAIGRLETLDSNTQFILEDLFTSKEWSNLQNLNQTYSLGRSFKKVVDLNVLSVEALPDNGGTQRYKKI
ncbi:hypothetical protein C672_3484 [[Clostridium] bifermentans ATCC 638]|uniref:DUF1413 domain-containing protein n=1 Tax=Paraclostridium bifermentans ATCC 638 = DSM 14991 TaxID=1233171 RepID=T4VF49_PARBF|nr:DUF1413 domain-containing protein [Paraclostridium bifermentans]EQK40118.1 hypothetical protein C672_3484 [[Clostridium] bifermentans ATCC 638] [Paraclostridium bifermentans ATCC 638 = DSM 14991]RIZ57346.1 DUF1413 domain-containing protein [Paraclostridium bifermentans]UAG20051.1 single-stranded DNA-binding protein [Paraclostridium bifermentans]